MRLVHNGLWAAVCHGETPDAHRFVVLDGDEQRELLLLNAYHAKFGDDLLLGWKTNDRLALAVADGETGLISDGPVITDAPIDHFVEFVSFPNGDVGWAHAAASGSVTLSRVSACN